VIRRHFFGYIPRNLLLVLGQVCDEVACFFLSCRVIVESLLLSAAAVLICGARDEGRRN